MELTKEVNNMGSYGLAVALNGGVGAGGVVRKLARTVVKIHDAIAAACNMELE